MNFLQINILPWSACAPSLCQLCGKLFSMETALNLLWLSVAMLLCGSCVVAGRRGKLRLSLWTGLICSVLLAVLLFPAISMTDDLQAANSGMELSLRHIFEPLPAPLLPTFLDGGALLLMCAFLLLVRQRLAERMSLEGRLPARMPRFRPAAIRPPTLLNFAR